MRVYQLHDEEIKLEEEFMYYDGPVLGRVNVEGIDLFFQMIDQRTDGFERNGCKAHSRTRVFGLYSLSDTQWDLAKTGPFEPSREQLMAIMIEVGVALEKV